MRKRNKGFTLIELLAVIVILALIALIATPIILNIIKDAKRSAAKDSAYGYIDAVEKYIVLAKTQTGNYKLELVPTEDKELTCKTKEECIKDTGLIGEVNKTIKGTKPSKIKLIIKGSEVATGTEITVDGFVFTYDGKKLTEVGETKEEEKEEEKKEVYADGDKVGVTKNGNKCEIGTTDCYTGYTYGDTKGATKLNLVIGYDANVTGSRNMKVSDLYTIVGLSVPYCNYDYFSTWPGASDGNCHVSGYNEKSCSDTCLVDNVIPEGYEWLYDFDYCENKNYLFRFDETWDYNPSGQNYSVNSTYGWILDKNKNKIVSSLISEKVCNPGGCTTKTGAANSCKMPKVVTVDKANFN